MAVVIKNCCFWILLCLFILITEAVAFGNVGSICRMKDNTYGYCEELRFCKWALEGIKSCKIQHEQLSRCSFDGDFEIICCADKRPSMTPTKQPIYFTTQNEDEIVFRDIPNEIISFDDRHRRTPPIKNATKHRDLKKIDEACGNYTKLSSPFISHTIINGIPTELGEFPHMVALGSPSEVVGTTGYTFDCGGILISDTFVLTAAHCVRIAPTIARMGKISLHTDLDGAKAQDIQIAEVFSHPRYQSPIHYNDIAVLRLAKAVIFNENVRPACIYTNVDDLDATTELIVTGWGAVATGSTTSPVLLKTNVSIVPLEKCNNTIVSYNPENRVLPNGLEGTQLCAANPMKNDACQGDSGGPLQIINHSVGMSTVVGIVSFGVFCGTDIPSVYTRVAEYIDWIEDIVWPSI